MATSGSVTVKVTSYNNLVFNWELVSQSIENNSSVVSWEMLLVAIGASGAIESGVKKPWEVVVNGNRYTGSGTTGIGGGEIKVLASGSTTIPHNADGSKTFAFSFMQEFKGLVFAGENITAKSGSGNGTLTRIPRASEPTLSASSVELGKTLTIYTNRASSSFTHRIYYGWYGTTFTQIATGVGASYAWTVPLTFANNIPDATSGWGTIRVETYDGSTKLGTADVAFTATVPASMRPTCAIQVLDATTTKDTYGNLVKSLSKLYVKTTATPSYNSPITAYRVTANGTQYTAAEITTGELTAAGTTTVSAYVTDKRGRTSATASASFTVLDYTDPKITALSVHRCDRDGNEDENGEYIKVTFSAAVTALNNKNTATYTLQYKKSTATSYTSVALTALANTYAVTNHNHVFAADSSASYDVVVTVEDSHGIGSRKTSASTAFTLMNWRASGTGMAVGKVAERDSAFEIGLRAYDQYGKHISNGMSLYGGANSPIDPNTSTEHLILTNTNVPSDGLWYVETIFYSTKLESSDRRQTAVPYRRGGPTYSRYYTSGAWSAWENDALAAWPVGSIYIAYNHTDPGTIFGGTWTRITNAFLWATTSGGTIGQTGGSATHTLTVNELPAHSHGSVYSQHAAGTKEQAWYTTAGSSLAYGAVSTGGGAAHNNMPPYIQVSVWRRTA